MNDGFKHKKLIQDFFLCECYLNLGTLTRVAIQCEIPCVLCVLKKKLRVQYIHI